MIQSDHNIQLYFGIKIKLTGNKRLIGTLEIITLMKIYTILTIKGNFILYIDCFECMQFFIKYQEPDS
jgi:hypothetical protein